MTFAAQVDVVRTLFSDAPIEESDEDKPGAMIDYDQAGNIVGLAHAIERASPGQRRYVA